jgi:uncharacterized protein YceK
MRKRQLLLALTTAVALGGCAEIRRHDARDAGKLLVTSGFTVQPADTPERAQQLHAMPALKMVSERKEGSITYRYADPYSCECLYVGDERAYAEYRRLALQKRIADERREETEEKNAYMGGGFRGPWWW